MTSSTHRLSCIFVPLLLLLVAGPIAATDDVPRTFQLGVADVVRIDVWKQEELSVSVPVRPDGLISLPLVGEVEAVGKRPAELQDELTTRFEEFVAAPAVSVTVEEINSMKVYITGRVASPGAYDIVRPTRLLQALALAGGTTEFARRGRVVLLRDLQDGSRERYEIDLKAVTTGRDTDFDVLLVPGDTIYVP
jgi:polysaccharide export outer membrane protein